MNLKELEPHVKFIYFLCNILPILNFLRSVGRKHIPHSGKKVYGILKSIQGIYKKLNLIKKLILRWLET